jgi:branched-chain amino acid transport system substrate-binding protein
MRGLRLLGAVGVLVAAVAGCNGPSTSSSGKPKEYLIGLIMPQTGSNAPYGADQVRASEWSVADINAKGGVNGTPLKLVEEDSQADPKRAITAFDKVVSVDKAPVVISAWSSVIKALAPMAEQNKVLLLSVGSNDPTIKKLGKYTRTAYPLADVDIAALAKYSATELGKKRAGLIYINNDTGKFAAEVYKKVFEANGGQVVVHESHEPDAVDYSTQIAKIKQANPDIIHFQSLTTEMVQIVLQIRQAGITTQLTTYSAEYPALVDRAPTASEGLLYTNLAPSGGDAYTTYLERWKKDVGRAPNGTPYTLYLYDAPYIIRDAIAYLEKNGLPYNADNLLKAIKDVKTFDLPLTGKTTFEDDGSVIKPVYIKRIHDKKFEVFKVLPVGY